MHYPLKNNQLEIAIITRDRSSILREWLNRNLIDIKSNNIRLSVYDSSSNDETELLTKQFSDFDYNIYYKRLDYDYRIDDKVLDSILKSKCEYIWPISDSLAPNFDLFLEKAFSFFEQKLDLIGVWNETVKEKEKIDYNTPYELFEDCFWHLTWLGGLIFRTDLFSSLQEVNEKNKYLSVFNRNDGFSYLGIFYNLIAKNNNIRAKIIAVEFNGFATAEKKKPAWVKRFYEVWCDNLCYLIDNLSIVYDPYKDKVVRSTWEFLHLDGFYWSCMARLNGGLNKSIFNKYFENRLLDRVTNHKGRIKLIAFMPCFFSRLCILIGKCLNYVKTVLGYIK